MLLCYTRKSIVILHLLMMELSLSRQSNVVSNRVFHVLCRSCRVWILMANLVSINIILFPSPQVLHFWLFEILRGLNRLPETKMFFFILLNTLRQWCFYIDVQNRKSIFSPSNFCHLPLGNLKSISMFSGSVPKPNHPVLQCKSCSTRVVHYQLKVAHLIKYVTQGF